MSRCAAHSSADAASSTNQAPREAGLPVGDPRRCYEEHDKPKSEVRCCSTLAPGDEYYHVKFTKCRYKKIDEPCQYMCNNEAT